MVRYIVIRDVQFSGHSSLLS